MQRLIQIFTPSHADADNTNAQNLTVKEIVARLPADLFHVTMLTSTAPDPRIAARKNTRLLHYGRRGNTARMLARVLTQVPDVYFFPRYGPMDQAFVFLRRQLRLRTALVTYMVMMMNDTTVSPFIERLVREADVALGNSVFVSETIQQHFGIRAETIYDGIDTRFYYPETSGDFSRRSSLSVLYAGSLQARKRVPLLIRQAARWPEVEFRLAGKGEEEAACRRLAAELGCRNVVFLGHVTSLQLGSEMRRASVFAFPSVLEGHPQVLGQAAACGLPIVAMNIYRPDYVVQGKTGFLVESDADFAQRLDLMLSDSNLRRSFSVAAVEHVRQFSWDLITKQWADIFHRAVQRRRAS